MDKKAANSCEKQVILSSDKSNDKKIAENRPENKSSACQQNHGDSISKAGTTMTKKQAKSKSASSSKDDAKKEDAKYICFAIKLSSKSKFCTIVYIYILHFSGD